MASRRGLSVTCDVARENHESYTSVPSPEQDSRSTFTELRRCHGQMSQVVGRMLVDSGFPSGSPSSQRDQEGDKALRRQISEIESEVRRQSEGQEGLRQGQMELKEQMTGIKESLVTSSRSLDDLCGERCSQHQSGTSSSSILYRLCSRTNSVSSFPTVFTPTSDMSDMSSGSSFFAAAAGIERQRDELEACLSREMVKNLESRLGRMELQEHQLSENLHLLQEKVQTLWQLGAQYRSSTVGSSTSSLHTDPLPPHIRAFCLKIEDIIHVRVDDLARYLGPSEDFEFRGGCSYRSAFWAVIRQWRSESREKGSVLLLETLLDACKKCGIPNPLEVEAMPVSDRRVLEQNYSYLANHVMVPMVLTYLRDTGMLTSDLVRYVLEPEPRPERVTRLVDIITVFGKHALHILKDSLRRSGQGHIADNLVYREEALDPDIPSSALPSVTVRLLESLKCQLREISAPIEQVRRQHEVCQLPTSKIWSGLFLNMDVSVKIPSHKVSPLSLLMEANQLRGLKHKNILKLIGVSLQADPPWIISESVKGNLLTHLRNLQEEDVGFSTFISMASQVCSGMLYMEGKGCIHGDLRAENVLMTDNKTLKVANFSIRIPEGNSLSGCNRWSAPETIKHGAMSSKTDVWSFGVLLWEIVTLGLVPYPDMNMSEMTDKVASGYIMPCPHTQFPLPDYLYDVMTMCWKYYASERTSFAHVSLFLSSTRPKSKHTRETSSSQSDAPDRTLRHSHADRRRSSLRRRKSLARDRAREDHGKSAAVCKEDDVEKSNVKKKKNRSLLQRLGLRKKFHYKL